MTGEAFITALEARLLPETITNMRGDAQSIKAAISDGRTVEIKRKRVRELPEAEIDAFLDSLLA